MSAIIRWENPPSDRPRAAAQFNSRAVGEALRGRPLSWAVVAHNPASLAIVTQIKTGRCVAFRPAGSFEAVTRRVDGSLLIYARYVGETS